MNQQEAIEYFKRIEPTLKKDYKRYQKAQAGLKNLAPKLVEVHKMLSGVYKSAFRNLFVFHNFGYSLKGCNERVYFNEERLMYYPWDESCQIVIHSNGNLLIFVNLWGSFFNMTNVPDHIAFYGFIKDSTGTMLSTLEKSVTELQEFCIEAEKVINSYNKRV